MYIKVKELIGENAMTLDDGEAVYARIHDPLTHGETVELDFDGVEVVHGCGFLVHGVLL